MESLIVILIGIGLGNVTGYMAGYSSAQKHYQKIIGQYMKERKQPE